MIKINKIAIVDEYSTAYTLKDDVLFFQHIGNCNQIYFSTEVEGGNFYEDWQEVDIEMMSDQFDYESIIKSLKGEE
tara:strand:- start:1071 stop:1298 length:228 start_codon:yes stop_codon:yes gene_type:complete